MPDFGIARPVRVGHWSALFCAIAAVTASTAVASPDGTLYSVHHRLGADLDGNGPQSITCFSIHDLNIPGATDDIVTFDGVEEAIRTDRFGTIPLVIESESTETGGLLLTISTEAPADLFPGGESSGGVPLTAACFSIGIDDPLTWAGSDRIVEAKLDLLIDDVVIVNQLDVISFFNPSDPWNGVVEITLPNAAGSGYNGVRLTLLLEKTITVTNDTCRRAIEVTDGDTPYSNIGATTDGPDEPTACRFPPDLYTHIEADIWYEYEATCTGILTVDLCDSSHPDPRVAVYAGCGDCPVESEPLACNDDFCGLRSYATLNVVQNQCYTIRIGGYRGQQGTGTMTLSCGVVPPPTGACCDDGDCLATLTEADCLGQKGTWFQGGTCPGFSCPISPPPNDECTNCTRVFTGVPATGRTRAATGNETSSCSTKGPDPFDAWNCWTADCTGRVTIRTCGSFFDTTLAVYDACDGTEIVCDNDSCPVSQFPQNRSQVELDVTEGTTYYIRVAGDNGAQGDYTLLVNECKNACCLSTGFCGLATTELCEAHPQGGTHMGPGSLCAGDLNGNGINDLCEACPSAVIDGASPPSGTVDARQPYPPSAFLPRQGIGSPGGAGARRESIVIELNPPLADAEGCFELCETKPDPILGANSINSVINQGAGFYELVLHHAITAGGVTTIEYQGGGSYVEYTAHPSNVDAGPTINASDVNEHVECCLLREPGGPCPNGAVWGPYSCDINRSLLVTPADMLGVIDLINGAGVWDIATWGASLPTQGSCP